MTKNDARQIFREKYLKRIDNEAFYLRIEVNYDEDGKCFSNDRGEKVELPKELVKYFHTTNLIVDLKTYRIINWKSEYGFMHVCINVRYNGRYELLNEIGECFCALETWPPQYVVPCRTDSKGQMGIIEFDIQSNGKLSNWPVPADLSVFKKYAQLYLTNEDKDWIRAQIGNPEGDPLIKNIPYNTCVGGYDEKDNAIGEQEFQDFVSAMDFVRELRDNPKTDYIHARTSSGYNVDFWRHSTYIWDNENGEPEEYEDEETSFSHIDEWIDNEMIDYVRRFILPDSLDLEIEEMNDLFGDGDNVNEEYSDDLPF